jgi:hypothetical protein
MKQVKSIPSAGMAVGNIPKATAAEPRGLDAELQRFRRYLGYPEE